MREWWNGQGDTRAERAWGAFLSAFFWTALVSAFLTPILGVIFGWVPD